MAFVSAEISTQPDTWREAAKLAAHPAVADALPVPGERVAVVGCGTSFYMAQSMAALRESSGAGETDAFAASQFPASRGYDRVVAVTRSGTTTEVVRLLGALPPGRRSTVVTTSAAVPAAARAGATVVLDFADEQAVTQTRFATTALALWRTHLGTDIEPVAAAAAEVLDGPLPPGADARAQFTFLGDGWTVGLANEAALKLREAAQAWAESYPGMEYRHGPISIADERSVVWFFGPPPAGLLDELAGTGALVVTSGRDPMAHLVAAQRLAVVLARRRGLDPDRPRHLTRAIVLPDTAAGP
jgi:fructoselysine-6-P-deglycase FrlB-like protein